MAVTEKLTHLQNFLGGHDSPLCDWDGFCCNRSIKFYKDKERRGYALCIKHVIEADERGLIDKTQVPAQ